MKQISNELESHLQGEVTTLTQCWKLTRRDATILGFTEHDVDLELDGVTYKAASGLTPTSVHSQSSLSVDNLDIEGMLDSAEISETDILAGRYDFAEIETFLVNYEDLTQGKLSLRTGWLGEVQLNKNQFIAEVRGLTQKLSQHIGELYSPMCRAKLGDNRCKIDLSAFEVVGSITGVESTGKATDSARVEAAGAYDAGLLTFTSGANSGIAREVKFFFAGGELQFALPFPYPIEIGDSYALTLGCNKTITDCVERYNNALNFRGEPHVPGVDKILQTASTRQ